jgi:hypothetical protein
MIDRKLRMPLPSRFPATRAKVRTHPADVEPLFIRRPAGTTMVIATLRGYFPIADLGGQVDYANDGGACLTRAATGRYH